MTRCEIKALQDELMKAACTSDRNICRAVNYEARNFIVGGKVAIKRADVIKTWPHMAKRYISPDGLDFHEPMFDYCGEEFDVVGVVSIPYDEGSKTRLDLAQTQIPWCISLGMVDIIEPGPAFVGELSPSIELNNFIEEFRGEI